MELGRAISYIFEDKQWVSKLLPLLLVGALSFIPILGLVATALGLGYLLHLAKNVREGLPRPLPDWTKWREKINVGGQLLLAMLIYNLPTIVMGLFSYVLLSGLTSGFFGSVVSILIACCTAPLLFLYSVLAWSMLAIGVSEYIETDETARFFRVRHQWDVLRVNNDVVFQWGLLAILVNFVLGIIGAIPCIGQIVVLLFAYPIQGHLLGQFAHRLSVVNKPKRASNIRASD